MTLKVGITGNIGSGKTTVCKLFELLGVPVFYADFEAQKLMTEDEVLAGEIRKNFGKEAYFEDGSLNRKHLATIVFNNDAELQKLNSIAHPAVFRAFDEWSLQQKHFYVLKEAALLFESGSNQQCDRTIVVSAALEERLRRVMQRDSMSREEVLRREKKQMPQAEKEAKADFIIKNDQQEMVIPQVLEIHRELLELAKSA